jgi:hypothetical protein
MTPVKLAAFTVALRSPVYQQPFPLMASPQSLPVRSGL